jgi:protein-L-isoaspartate(D-aspartate) O-methyltransferase
MKSLPVERILEEIMSDLSKESCFARRRDLVELLRREGIKQEDVLQAFASVPRELFVPQDERRAAYANHPLPIGEGQTISQPLMIALMMEALDLKCHHKVLEVGTGSGYQAALLSKLVREVISIERVGVLSERAALVLWDLEVTNVRLVTGDGSLGFADAAPFDRILVTAGAPRVPEALVRQLAPGGRLVVPVGSPGFQDLKIVTVDEKGDPHVESHGGCYFVPLIGQDAWSL